MGPFISKITCSNFIFGTGNLQQCLVVPTKLQVLECIGCLNIRDVRCDVGAPFTCSSDLYSKFVLLQELQ